MKVKMFMFLAAFFMIAALNASIASAKEYTSSDVTYNYDTEPQGYKDLNWSYQYNVQ